MNINEALNVLHLNGNVTKDEVAKAYKKLSLKYHPARNSTGVEMMKVINSAYDFLKGLNFDSFKHTAPESAYNYCEKLETVIAEVKKMEGVVIEVCGNWIWLSGETRNFKDQVKSLGFFWAGKKQKWYFRPSEHKSSPHKAWDMDEIRSKYGSEVIKNEESEKVDKPKRTRKSKTGLH